MSAESECEMRMVKTPVTDCLTLRLPAVGASWESVVTFPAGSHSCRLQSPLSKQLYCGVIYV